MNCSGCYKSDPIDCPTRKEEEIMTLQQSRKIGRGRALQRLRQGGDNTTTCKEEKYLEIAVEKEDMSIQNGKMPKNKV